MANGDGNAEGQDYDVTAPLSIWIGLIVLSAISLWDQAVITEERFVPSLNVLATYYRIPDDIAGATLMAAGASSPELLASFTTLFVTHSSLGIGTIVGSEIFNQLMICAGSIWAARNTQLHLNKAIVLREVSFYGLSLALLLIALSDRRQVDGSIHIFIRFWDGLLLFAGYAVYVSVCMYYEQILRFLDERLGYQKEMVVDTTRLPSVSERPESPSIEAVLPFLRMISSEPSTNFRHRSGSIGIDMESEEELCPSHYHDNMVASPHVSTPTKGGPMSPVSGMIKFLVAPTKPKPSTIHGLEDIVRDEN